MDPRLREAAQTGNIDILYALIQEDPYILERIDQVPFVDTPFHIAASEGHINFNMEMMNLKPSFARKLNQDGFSPMHLALKNEQTKLVLRLLEKDKDLVRVKGREGITPFHLVSITGNLDLMIELLEACPECIEDVTVNNETALHLALKNDQIEAFKLLLRWLQMNIHKSANRWEGKIANWRDNEDNTVLHIAAKRKQNLVIKMISNSYLNVDIHVKNSEGLTALNIIKPGENWETQVVMEKETKYGKYTKPRMGRWKRLSVMRDRMKKNMSTDVLNAVLVVMALVITATYQSCLSPPGGVFQGDSSSSISTSSNITHFVHSSSDPASQNLFAKTGKTGTTVMGLDDFSGFLLFNCFSFWYTIFQIQWLLSAVPLLLPSLFTPIMFLGFSYQHSLRILSPSRVWSEINHYATLLLMCLLLINEFKIRGSKLQSVSNKVELREVLRQGNNARNKKFRIRRFFKKIKFYIKMIW